MKHSIASSEIGRVLVTDFKIESNLNAAAGENPILLTDGEIEAVAGGYTADPENPDKPNPWHQPQ